MLTAGPVHPTPNSSYSERLHFLWLEITEKCNLQCIHCYAGSGPHGRLEGDMHLNDWLRVLDEAYELGCRSIQFIGGEPTLHPHFKEILRYAGKKSFDSIEVFTNGTRISSDLIGCAKEYPVRLATSFYASDFHVHDAITLSNGSWNRTVNGIRKAVDSNIPLRVGIIAMEKNLDQIEQAIAFLKSLGVSQIGVDHQRKVGRGASAANAQQDHCDAYAELCGQCWKQRMCVTAARDIFPCVFSRSTLLGRVHNGLKAAYESATRRDFCENLRTAKEISNPTSASCWPDLPCNPQNPCSPELPCNPQVFCNPDSGCQPQYGIGA
jgi:MoaA/NifB/PqqE/SkfB family radical SAM enzyme